MRSPVNWLYDTVIVPIPDCDTPIEQKFDKAGYLRQGNPCARAWTSA